MSAQIIPFPARPAPEPVLPDAAVNFIEFGIHIAVTQLICDRFDEKLDEVCRIIERAAER